MKILRDLMFVMIAVLCFSACGGVGTASRLDADIKDSIKFKYATLLSYHSYKGYDVADVRNPWDSSKLLHRYVIVDSSKPIPDDLPDGTLLRTPMKRCVMFSSVHCGLVNLFGKMENVVGVCDLNYILLPEVISEVKKGTIKDMGSSLTPNVENILRSKPDGLFVSPFENSGGYGLLDKSGLPLIECADYMERSALGRAEWMRFYGRLMGCAEKSDSLFEAIEYQYSMLKEMIVDKEKPSLLCDRRDGAAWYVPGGQSTLGQLYVDAGANYLFSNYKESGSVRLSFETVFNKAQNADVWLIKYGQAKPLTYTQMANDFSPYTKFKAYKQKQIYVCNTSIVPYYEETPFRPDLLMRDLVKIFHPTFFKTEKLRYFCPLE